MNTCWKMLMFPGFEYFFCCLSGIKLSFMHQRNGWWIFYIVLQAQDSVLLPFVTTA